MDAMSGEQTNVDPVSQLHLPDLSDDDVTPTFVTLCGEGCFNEEQKWDGGEEVEFGFPDYRNDRATTPFPGQTHSSLTVETPLLIEYFGGSGHSTPAASDPADPLTGSRRNVNFPYSIEICVQTVVAL
ncbi:hypothetical protein PC117_g2481 [Phytophthora cactorum]|uniref:Uncharacterized protein n=1 Tax=Phytophthora cactorum TaxID=29920 RepID=A0A8T1EGP5_9STRA|nr:hypothetical protein PC117_g2481 [Phytophthora cactorum]